MSEQRVCEYCQESFMGRPNQEYCSNAHKVRAFRKREEEEKQKVESLRDSLFFLKHSPSAYHMRKYPHICGELNWIYGAFSTCKDISSLEGRYKYTELKERFKEESQSYLHLSKLIEGRLQKEE